MQCDYCGSFNEQVFRTKERIKSNEIVRIRVCFGCGAKIPTVERVDRHAMEKLNPTKKIKTLIPTTL